MRAICWAAINVRAQCEPWIAAPALTLLHELLLPGTARALEWGGGPSTLWLLGGHAGALVTVQREPGWVLQLWAQAVSTYGSGCLKVRAAVAAARWGVPGG